LSTLTKILIVLLTLSTLFLCGIVVTKISIDQDYKQKNEELNRQFNLAKDKQQSAEEKLKNRTQKWQNTENNLKNKIASIEAQLEETKVELKNVERERAQLLQKVNSWASITKDFSETTDKQQQMFENTFEQLNKVKSEKVKLENQIEDVTSKLMEKNAVIDTLETKNKRLVEQKTELQNKIDKLLAQKPIEANEVEAEPVTPQPGPTARQTPRMQQEKALNGTVTNLNLEESMAEISIGSADGVKEGMKFYVIRGDEFVCELLILDVEPESAVGAMERVQYQPQAGDKVTNSLWE